MPVIVKCWYCVPDEIHKTNTVPAYMKMDVHIALLFMTYPIGWLVSNCFNIFFLLDMLLPKPVQMPCHYHHHHEVNFLNQNHSVDHCVLIFFGFCFLLI